MGHVRVAYTVVVLPEASHAQNHQGQNLAEASAETFEQIHVLTQHQLSQTTIRGLALGAQIPRNDARTEALRVHGNDGVRVKRQ